jgi:hypothetical protein
MASPGQIDAWKIQEVLKYLAKHFPSARLDDYPRGVVAHLFVVTDGAVDPRKRSRHHLMITRQFFDRLTDAATVKDALEAADVARSLTKAGERSVDLY